MADDINSNIPEEELPEGIIELTDEDGVTTQFEYLTTIDHEGELYVVLMVLGDEERGLALLDANFFLQAAEVMRNGEK